MNKNEQHMARENKQAQEVTKIKKEERIQGKAEERRRQKKEKKEKERRRKKEEK